MQPVFVVEAQLIDHPDYETFVGVYVSQAAAIEAVTKQLNEIIADLGEGEIKTTVTGEHNIRVEITDDQVYFISSHIPK